MCEYMFPPDDRETQHGDRVANVGIVIPEGARPPGFESVCVDGNLNAKLRQEL